MPGGERDRSFLGGLVRQSVHGHIQKLWGNPRTTGARKSRYKSLDSQEGPFCVRGAGTTDSVFELLCIQNGNPRLHRESLERCQLLGCLLRSHGALAVRINAFGVGAVPRGSPARHSSHTQAHSAFFPSRRLNSAEMPRSCAKVHRSHLKAQTDGRRASRCRLKGLEARGYGKHEDAIGEQKREYTRLAIVDRVTSGLSS